MQFWATVGGMFWLHINFCSVIFLTVDTFFFTLFLAVSQWKAPDLGRMFSWQRTKSVVSASNPERSSSASQSCLNLRRPSRFVVRLSCFLSVWGIHLSCCTAFANTVHGWRSLQGWINTQGAHMMLRLLKTFKCHSIFKNDNNCEIAVQTAFQVCDCDPVSLLHG